jgi:iterative type I PKS product template protein
VYRLVCHAPHLYNRTHALQILKTLDTAFGDQLLNRPIRLLSPADGQPIVAATARELLERVVMLILTDLVRWDNVVASVLDHQLSLSAHEFQVYNVGPSRLVTNLVSKISGKNQQCKTEVVNLKSWILADAQGTTVETADTKIAIVGMSCRFPGGADDLDLYWDILKEGRDVHQKVPIDRYDVDSHTDPTGQRRNTSLTPFGCFVDEPGLFDAGFFNMSPREAAQTDPMHRLALVTAYEALEQSGFVADRTASTARKNVGTFYGQACDDYREVNSGQDVDTYFIPGGCRAFAPGRISYFFKFSGPSFDCDTACSSSLATVQIACTSLLHGDCNMVVAGGLNILTNSDGFAGLSRGHFLSKTGSCKTWDVNADGYCRADGIGSVVMKRLEDAIADNDNILGVISSSATNHSADAISITHPHAPTQASLYQHIMSQAGVSPTDVDFVELHGTGTQAGDATEIESVTNVYSPPWPRRSIPLTIGAVKANMGHGEAAAGIMALIKVLLVLKKGVIPRHVGIKTALNPLFPDLDKLNVRIPYDEVPWDRDLNRKRYAVVNNFSAAGGNTAVLLEESPLRPEPEEDPRNEYVVAVSAKSKVSLKKNLESLIAHLEPNPSMRLADLSYTTTARRMHHNHRISVHGRNLDEISRSLRKHLPTAATHRPIPATAPSIAFTFSGQGTFYPRIGRQLFDSHPLFKAEILQLEEICAHHGFASFVPALAEDFPPHHEFEPVITQLTILCVQIALCRLLESINIRPCIVVGASLGEYAAFYAAGILSASDAISLVGRRALLLQELCTPNTHSMLAVTASAEWIAEIAEGRPYELACVNSRDTVCISGPLDELSDIRARIEAHGRHCVQLRVPFAFHSFQMDPILDKFEEIAGGATFKAPTIPVIAPLLGDCVFDGQTINASYVQEATRKTVRFTEAMDKALEMGLIDDRNTAWIDIGPNPICCNFIKSSMPSLAITAATLKRDEDNFCTLSQTLAQLHNAGVEIDWNAWHSPFEKNLRLIDLPAYKWNNKNYWLQYNGDWMLYKDQMPAVVSLTTEPASTLRTSLVHRVVRERSWKTGAELVIQSDLMQPEFLEAASGHRMNGHNVVTSVSAFLAPLSCLHDASLTISQSIHADVGFTLAAHLYSLMKPESPTPGLDMKNLQVEKGLIGCNDQSRPQWIEVRAVADLTTRSVDLSWYNVDQSGQAEEQFATATIEYGDNKAWLEEWSHYAHLVSGRMDVLDQMANQGIANRLSRDMAYTLFGNLVDYAKKYRGMQSVVLNGLEASAKVTLSSDGIGKWTVAPHHIDGVFHIGGFVLNGGDAVDVRNNFFVTPGWKSMRFAKPLVAGGHYRSYVKMVAQQSQPGFFQGDVYVLQGDEIIGLLQGMTFRTFPRVLLGSLFTPPDLKQKTKESALSSARSTPSARSATASRLVASTPSPAPSAPSALSSAPSAPSAPSTTSKPAASTQSSTPSAQQTSTSSLSSTSTSSSSGNPAVTGALKLIATETALDVSELTDETEFIAIGVDSLLSLVLSEKFAAELKIQVRSSLFLECPTIRDLKTWLTEYC